MDNTKISDEDAAKFLSEKDKELSQTIKLNDIESKFVDKTSNGLGKIKELQPQTGSNISSVADAGWKNIPLENLETKGLFYEDDIEITIKSASVGEIRQWSTIDENDFVDIDDKLNIIMEKCVRIRKKGDTPKFLSWKDIKEIDRIALAFLIHEITFPNGENKLMITFKCNQSCAGDGQYSEKVKMESNMLSLFDFDNALMQYYSQEDKCFILNDPRIGKPQKIFIPSLGISQKIKAYVKNKQDNNLFIDKAFIRLSPFIIDKYQTLNNNELDRMQQESLLWGKDKFLLISSFIDKIEKSARGVVSKECPKCSVQLETPLFFRGGFKIKDLFSLSIGFNGDN